MAADLAVIGSGYVGSVVAACLAFLGNNVIAIEVDEKKLRLLKRGRAPFYESGLNDLIAEGLAAKRLSFTNDIGAATAECDIVFLCVGTPANGNGRADMIAVRSAAEALAAALDTRKILVTKSTVPIGSGNWLAAIVEDALPAGVRREALLSVVSNPEFLREGSAVNDFLYPDRVVLGSDDAESIAAIAELYDPILEQSFPGADPARKPGLVKTTLVTAETIKYASNAFLATKISFINEVSRICELVGADVTEVAAGMGLDGRIGARFLDAGVGWGGSCFVKDVRALIETGREFGYEAELLEATLAVNERQRDFVIDKLQRHLKTLHGRRIALLGLAFKPGTDDLRESPAVWLAEQLRDRGALVSAYDPIVNTIRHSDVRVAGTAYEAADRADAVILVTDWPEFLALDLGMLRERMRGNLFIDGRNVFDPATLEEQGFAYEGIGRAAGGIRAAIGS